MQVRVLPDMKARTVLMYSRRGFHIHGAGDILYEQARGGGAVNGYTMLNGADTGYTQPGQFTT